MTFVPGLALPCLLLVGGVALGACGDGLPRPPAPSCNEWHQWGNNAAHTGASCAAGQPLQRLLADIVIDPFVDQELGLVHYQVPLIAGGRVFAMTKRGRFTPCLPSDDPLQYCRQPGDLYRRDSQVWAERAFEWHGDVLDQIWEVDSDWKPPPGIETVFQPVMVADRIAIPAAGGSIHELDVATGELVREVVPFGDDPNTYVTGALATDHGILYYSAIRVDHDQPYARPMQAWLVAVEPEGGVRTADYASLIPGAPAADAACFTTYFDTSVPPPWPPSPNPDGTPVVPGTAPCGAQVPGLSSAPAFAFDGTLYLATHAQYNEAYSYLAAIDPGELQARWATSLRDRLHDGCGVTIPFKADASPNQVSCRDGAPVGVEPNTGMLPAAYVDDASSSTPVALPDGGVVYGAFTGYNGARGHLIALADDGRFVGAYDFGWDTTPAVIAGPDGDRLLLKDNHYGEWNTPVGPYYLTELDAKLQPAWQFQSTETRSCVRQSDGTPSCTDDHPHGFEWCINAPAVDRDGTLYANSEDGHLYAIRADGSLRDRIFLDAARGAAYTPLSLDEAGRIYAQNAGHMIVVGAD